jgi:hypothetical protein
MSLKEHTCTVDSRFHNILSTGLSLQHLESQKPSEKTSTQKDQSAYKTNQRNYMQNIKGTYLKQPQLGELPRLGDQPWRTEGKRSAEALK